jgi:hypothetical protein
MPTRWTDTEKQHLREHYPFIGTKRLTELLPGRTPMAIYRQAFMEDLKKTHDRLIEQGRENVSLRKDRQPFVQPPSISS